jgi:hypothetical protein
LLPKEEKVKYRFRVPASEWKAYFAPDVSFFVKFCFACLMVCHFTIALVIAAFARGIPTATADSPNQQVAQA